MTHIDDSAPIIRKACEEMVRIWEAQARNMRVMAEAGDSEWPTPPAEAHRKLKAIEHDIAALRDALAPNPWDSVFDKAPKKPRKASEEASR